MGLLDRFRRNAPATVPEGQDAAIYQGTVSPGTPVQPDLDPAAVLSTAASYPWVWAAVRAVVDDLAGLPWYTEAEDGEPVDHPDLTRLLDRPRPGEAGTILRRQHLADIVAASNGYLMIDTPRAPQLLTRLHPDHIEAQADVYGRPVLWEVGASVVQRVDTDRIIHTRAISYGADIAASLYGTSPISPIRPLLGAEKAIALRMQKDATLARPDSVLTPPDNATWTPAQVKRLGDWIREWMTSRGGVLVLPDGGKFTPVGSTAKDMDYQQGQARITAAILAVFRVPPTRVGIQAANYATAQQEALLHWEARKADAELVESAYTDLARRWDGYEFTRYRLDFSGVDALQAGRDAQLRRVGQHILNGIAPAKAYELEGMDDAAQAAQDVATETPAPATGTDADRIARERGRHLRAALEALEAGSGEGLTGGELLTIAASVSAALRADRVH
jgi:phage portal protein BeeE